MVRGLWDDDPPAASPVASKPVLFVHGVFFMRRGTTMEDRKQEFSDKVLKALTEKFHDHHIVVHVPSAFAEWMTPPLTSANIRFFITDPKNVLDTTARMRAVLNDVGITLRPKTERQATHLNVSKFVLSGTLRALDADDYAAAGIEPEKEATFAELQQARQRRSLWD